MNFKVAAMSACSTAALLLSGVIVASPGIALAQTAASGPTELGEIVVTARRRSESLQEVPQTVNAVTADTLQKLNIRQFADIQTVVPGLTLAQRQGPTSGEASMRGVTFNSFTAAQPTVAFYLNDAPLSPSELFQSMFDIGQIEVLKGPQGTVRGISAPSGAITVTTRKPSLSEFGGYVDVTATDQKARNAQGAINIPVIKDVLAVRVAGVIDENAGDHVRSIHSALAPKTTTSAERISVSFEPTDAFNANVVYQHFDRKVLNFNQVEGPGRGTTVDPPLAAADRASVQDQPGGSSTHLDFVNLQLDSRIFGQHLSYTGAYRRQGVVSQPAQDRGDLLPGTEVFQHTTTAATSTTHEVRLASDPAPGRFFDYTVGAFYSWQNSEVNNTSLAFFLPGAQPNPNSAFQSLTTGPTVFQETSLFGNVTLHLGAQTELSGGVRHIWSITNSGLQGSLVSPSLPGLVIPLNLGGSHRYSSTPNIYNVSLSHHFSRDLLAYVTTGTAFRPPIAVPVPPAAFPASNNPDIQALAFHPAETSRSYEVGVKSTWLDGRARVNVAVFRQRFDNLSFFTSPILNRDLTTGAVQLNQLTANANALVNGVDLDAAFQVTREWNISLQYSYAHSQSSSPLPCNTGTLQNPNFNTGDQHFPVNGGPTSGVISFCSGGSPTRLPLWSLSAQSEYMHPITDTYDGFLRGQLSYYPENKYLEPGSGFASSSYGLLNMFAGVRSHDGAWEVSVFARNLTGTNTTLDINPAQANLGGAFRFFPALAAQQSGYYEVTGYTPPREVGVNVHYAWGAR
jgi:iron complex outermembrane receptor protein